jgi:hypothetical protein
MFVPNDAKDATRKDFFQACEEGNLKVVKEIIESGKDLNVYSPYNGRKMTDFLKEGFEIACLNNQISLMEYFVSFGFDPCYDDDCVAEEVICCRNVNLKTLKYLFDVGVDFTTEENACFVLSFYSGKVEFFEFLINIGCCPTFRKSNYSVLPFPEKEEVVKFIDILIKYDLDVKSILNKMRLKETWDRYCLSKNGHKKTVFLLNKKFKLINKDLIKEM